MKDQFSKRILTASGAVLRSDDPAIRDMVAKKAYELFEKRGYQHGHHEEDWIEAERIVCSQLQPVSELGTKSSYRSPSRPAPQRRPNSRR